MRIIINEGQSESLIQNYLSKIFDGYELKFDQSVRNVIVDGVLKMIIQPNRVIIDKNIVDNITDKFFFDDIKDLKQIIREWVINNFGVKKSNQVFFGVQFKNLSKNSEDGKYEQQNESEITERCWKGYTQKGMKTMFGKRYPNCVKKKK
jgi:hypothetical protein